MWKLIIKEKYDNLIKCERWKLYANLCNAGKQNAIITKYNNNKRWMLKENFPRTKKGLK